MRYRYHCILSNVPENERLLVVNQAGYKADIYRECEDFVVLTEQEFEDYKKPYHATHGWCFARLINKEEWVRK